MIIDFIISTGLALFYLVCEPRSPYRRQYWIRVSGHGTNGMLLYHHVLWYVVFGTGAQISIR